MQQSILNVTLYYRDEKLYGSQRKSSTFNGGSIYPTRSRMNFFTFDEFPIIFNKQVERKFHKLLVAM